VNSLSDTRPLEFLHSPCPENLGTARSRTCVSTNSRGCVTLGIWWVSLLVVILGLQGCGESPRWIRIKYAPLLDLGELTQTGESLGSVLGDPETVRAVAPLVASYTSLLDHAVEMLDAVNEVPLTDVCEAYSVGSRQPAWATILRGGRIRVVTDGQAHCRVFLVGDDPRRAYANEYHVLRHCLNGLVRSGSGLTAEIYAFQHDYSGSELRLNTRPYTVSAPDFPTKRSPLDLEGLEGFFAKKPTLVGAQLSRTKGLVLYGKSGTVQTLSGKPVSLSDLAVVYRAVVHAGVNEAFVSLDPHKDPTMARVNFGGFLEDTRVGAVVLEADKRFKTIASGMDADSHEDLRRYTRAHVPSFRTNSERGLAGFGRTGSRGWIGTRYWFYPDSILVDSDLAYEFAAVVRSTFVADAERSRSDFLSPEDFAARKRTSLSPSVLMNIRHLNDRFPSYARAFRELDELTVVARLFGICSWLRKANPEWLDLDALLSVELPALSTERVRTRLLTAATVSLPASERSNEDYVLEHSVVVDLTPLLDQSIKGVFKNPTGIAEWLCIADGADSDKSKLYLSKAEQIWGASSDKKVRDAIHSQEMVRALASWGAETVSPKKTPQLLAMERAISEGEGEMKDVEAAIISAKRTLERLDGLAYNRMVDHHNELVARQRRLVTQLNRRIDHYNGFLSRVSQPVITRVSGGINLNARLIGIRRVSQSHSLNALARIAKEPFGSQVLRSEGWLRSRSSSGTPAGRREIPIQKWTIALIDAVATYTYRKLVTESGMPYWQRLDTPGGSWRDLMKLRPQTYRERLFDKPSGALYVADFEAGKVKDHIVGRFEARDVISFTRSPRGDLMAPQEPPVWWKAE
jgi:hypothetical protein